MATGDKKGHLAGPASPDHAGVPQQPPAEAFVPARVILTSRSFEEVVQRLRSPGRPTKELRELMRGGRDRTTRERDR